MSNLHGTEKYIKGKNKMKENREDRRILAAAFDMDGTLLDSMPRWREINVQFARDLGANPTPEQEKEMIQCSGTMLISYFKEVFGIERDYATLAAKAHERMEQVYREGVPVKKNVETYLQSLHDRGILCVLATATPVRLTTIALNRSGLMKYFDYIFTADLMGCSKARPEFFEKMCREIHCPAEQCEFYDDAYYALKTAYDLGIRTVGMHDSTNEWDWEHMSEVTCEKRWEF